MNENSMSITHLIMSASPVVQIVMGLLVFASLLSWIVIFQRSLALSKANKAYQAFEATFWSGVDLNEFYADLPNDGERQGAEHLFQTGFRDFQRLVETVGQPQDVLDGVQRSMRVAWSREEQRLNRHLVFLATVASASPYVGLFGTVWGIMGSFQSLSLTQQATLATIAPFIAEALIATAMGLLVAIPAVIFYNRLSSHASQLLADYENFAEEFYAILHRNLKIRDAG